MRKRRFCRGFWKCWQNVLADLAETACWGERVGGVGMGGCLRVGFACAAAWASLRLDRLAAAGLGQWQRGSK